MFTEDKLDEELAKVRNDVSKIKSVMQVLEDGLLDPNEASRN